MSHRYYVDSPIRGDRAKLADAEAHHLLHVMRGRPGDEVMLFDGSGSQFLARIHEVGRATVELAVVSREEVNRELSCSLTLGVALPKGDRQRWLVEKAVELGVTRLVPLRAERATAQPTAQALTRLRRAVIEASKQCGRNRLMEIDEARDWPDYVASPPARARKLMAHPGAGAVSARDWTAAEEIVLAIGPEGGFTPEEAELAGESGWKMIDLGPRVLRVETAAVLLSAVVMLGLGPQ